MMMKFLKVIFKKIKPILSKCYNYDKYFDKVSQNDNQFKRISQRDISIISSNNTRLLQIFQKIKDQFPHKSFQTRLFKNYSGRKRCKQLYYDKADSNLQFNINDETFAEEQKSQKNQQNKNLEELQLIESSFGHFESEKSEVVLHFLNSNLLDEIYRSNWWYEKRRNKLKITMVFFEKDKAIKNWNEIVLIFINKLQRLNLLAHFTFYAKTNIDLNSWIFGDLSHFIDFNLTLYLDDQKMIQVKHKNTLKIVDAHPNPSQIVKICQSSPIEKIKIVSDHNNNNNNDSVFKVDAHTSMELILYSGKLQKIQVNNCIIQGSLFNEMRSTYTLPLFFFKLCSPHLLTNPKLVLLDLYFD